MARSAEPSRGAAAERHSTDGELLELALGGLDAPHLASCARCASRLRHAAELLRADRVASPADAAFYRRQAAAVARRIEQGAARRPWARSRLLWPAAAAASLALALLLAPARRPDTVPPGAPAAPQAALAAGDALLQQIDAVLAADPYDHALELWSLAVTAEDDSPGEAPAASG